MDVQDITSLINTGLTGTLALYSGISGNPVYTYPVNNPAAGLPAVSQVPSATTAGLAGAFSNPIVIGLGALVLIAVLWKSQE